MNRLWWYLQPLQSRRDSGPQEIEALQTDVMRFMAILGLVLMAIFALVQSLEVGPKDGRPKLEDPRQLTQEVERLKQQLHGLQQQLAEAKKRLNQIRKEEKKARNLQKQASLEAQKAESLREQAEMGLEGITHSLQQATQTLLERERQLALLERQIKQQQRSLVELRRDIEIQRRALSTTEKKLAAIRQTLEKSPQAAPAPSSDGGFSLHFASDEALTFLARTNQVQIYALLDNRAWQLEATPQNVHFRPSNVPNKFYEMDPQTVPQDYLRAIKKTLPAFKALRLTWGIILPQQTRNQINQFISQHPGGDLVIQKDNTVTFVPTN